MRGNEYLNVNNSYNSFLRDIAKQHHARCDAAECDIPFWALLFAYRKIKYNFKITPEVSKNESGLGMVKSILDKSVNMTANDFRV